MNEENGLLFAFLTNKDFHFSDLTQNLKLKVLENKEDILKIKHVNGSNNDPSSQNHFFLQPEEINEINFFLKFSSKEVSKFNHCFDRLFKVVNFNSLKQKELNDSLKLLVKAETGSDVNFKELQLLQKALGDTIKEFRFNSDICHEILQLSISTNEFVTKITNLINNKIFKWWRLYGELIELNNSYKKFKYVEVKKNKHNHDGTEHLNGLIEVNEESFNDFTKNNHLFKQSSENGNGTKTNKKTSQTSVGQPSFLTNFVESKRQKFENKLLAGLKAVKISLIELNKDIKYNHELIAMELNRFMNFKNNFLKMVLDKYVKNEIKNLKFRTLMLRRNLDDLKSLKR
jgi:hypothetical protein